MVSHGYPPLQGRSPTCYSPVRHSTQHPKMPFSFDLHVLSTPPAFILSQDQTLRNILLLSTASAVFCSFDRVNFYVVFFPVTFQLLRFSFKFTANKNRHPFLSPDVGTETYFTSRLSLLLPNFLLSQASFCSRRYLVVYHSCRSLSNLFLIS